ncbi:hypothetical protein SO694_00011429 [Aureococcus anophagefferens]|uniref:Uncharacterized protein n=1 Tax=Aureococcus anophagefferens TaxID=44056 RepID=A0ABR1GEL2_AURAN
MTIPGHPPAEERALPRTVAMFRQQQQRVISACISNGKHCDGFQEIDKDPNWKHLTVAEYARHAGAPRRLVFEHVLACKRRRLEKMPAGNTTERSRAARIPGCTTRMLLGGKCARARHVTRDFDAAKAVANVRRLAFVGILERWREHLYVVVFPGNCRRFFRLGALPQDARRAAVGRRVRHHALHARRPREEGGLHEAPKPYDGSVLEGVEDPDEGAWSTRADDAFDRQLRRHAPNCPRR